MVPGSTPPHRRGRRTRERALTTVTDDRQVLVVGDGVAGLAATSALRRAGYDPVVLTGHDRTPPSELATLHPLGRSLLDRLAADADDRTDPGVVELAAADSPGNGPGGRYRQMVTTTDAVREPLAATVPAATCRTDELRRLEREGDALCVRFASGVREWFDLVVAADGPASTVRAARNDPLDATDATQVEAHVPTETDAATRRDTWTDDALVEALSHPEGGTLVRLTTDRLPRGESPRSSVERVTETLDGPGFDDPTDVVARTVAQADDGGDWANGRVAYCGAAAFPLAPATGLRTTLALADARVLADELLTGSSSVTAALAAYGRRRRRHVERLRESVDGRPDGSRQDPLGSVRRDRALSLDGCDLLRDASAL